MADAAITLSDIGGRGWRFMTLEESIHLALSRKRRLRLIYKWRHGLPHTHQPARRDRGKIRYLEMFHGQVRD